MLDQKYIQEIKTICSNFLIKHGGALNGYLTYIEGSTERNTAFTVELPDNYNRTRKQNDKISDDLKTELFKYLVENRINVIIKFIHVHVEHGYHNTYIEFVYPAGRLF